MFLRLRIDQIKSKHLDLREQGWPGEAAFSQLVNRASGLFIWATTAAQFLDAYDPTARLRLLLGGSSNDELEGRLDSLYRTALGSAGEWDNGGFVQDFRSIMGIVLASARPLSASAIDHLRQRSNGQHSCAHIISHLGPLMQQKPVVRLLHPSFADFLLTRSRSARECWVFDQVALNYDFAIWCINRLNSDLKTNICDLELSPEPVDECLPEDVEYACMYWVEHLCRLQVTDSGIVQLLDSFISQHLLHWLEAMSILRMTRDSINLLEELLVWLTVSGCLRDLLLSQLILFS